MHVDAIKSLRVRLNIWTPCKIPQRGARIEMRYGITHDDHSNSGLL